MAKKIKRYKVGTDSETYAISMVEMPAIESDFVALSKDEEEKLQVFLESNERHMCYGAALIPDKDIYRNNGEQEFYISFTKESIEKMSQDFMKNYRQNEVTLDHEDMANDITITESWLVEDPYKDKANALGINVPQGTWMIGMKVNQIDVWDRVKAGELKGFSVESMISLEEFSKNNNDMIDTNEDMFFDKIKNAFKEVLATVSMSKAEETEQIDPVNEIELEAETPAPTEPTVETPTEAPKTEEPTVEPEPSQEAVVEPKNEPTEAPKTEESKDNHLEELINSMRDEIKALKEMNEGLTEKIKDMGKQPSAQPISVHGGNGNNTDSYYQWRETMRRML